MPPKSWLDHKALMIIKGVGKTPGDNNSAENDPVVVNLMQKDGPFTLDTNGWTPNIPATKNGGVWADSPVSDGRQLIAAASSNVIEKMTLNIASNSYLGAIKAYSDLNQMALDCRAFSETQGQIDPVYLVWFAGCGAGPQYALIYNIELAPEYKDSNQPTIQVSVTIERESFWRGIPPGVSPRMWTLYITNRQQNFSNLNFSLLSDTLANKFEWTPAAAGAQTTPLRKNYLDIPATSINGDAPCLMQIQFNHFQMANLYLGLTSKKQSLINHAGVVKYNALNLNVGDSDVSGTMAKTVSGSTDGMKSNGSAVNQYYGLRTKTGADANMVQVAQWGNNPTSANSITLDRNFFRGTYAIFVRASNNSAAPVLSDMDMQLTIEEIEGVAGTILSDSWSSAITAIPLAVGAVPYAPISFMGVISIPFSTRAVNSQSQYGLQIQQGATSGSNLRVTLYVRDNVATANRIVRAYDVMFMPIDEGFCQVVVPYNGGSGDVNGILDNTGYLARGEPQQVCLGYSFSSISGGVSLEVRGADLILQRKTDYRLYALFDQYFSATTIAANTIDPPGIGAIILNVDLMPRWSGIRDV